MLINKLLLRKQKEKIKSDECSQKIYYSIKKYLIEKTVQIFYNKLEQNV
jgi:hypothetical protein